MDILIRSQFQRGTLPRKLVLLNDLVLTMAALLPAYLLRYNLQIDQVKFSELFLQQVLILFPVYLGAFLWSGSYRGIIRHSDMEDAARYSHALVAGTVALLLLSWVGRELKWVEHWIIPYSVILIHGFISMVALMGFRQIIRTMYLSYGVPRKNYRSVLIFGAGELGQITRRVVENDSNMRVTVMGYIDDSPSLVGKRLGGVMIYSEEQAFTKVLVITSYSIHYTKLYET